MILGIGIDVVEVPRMEQILDRPGSRFRDRVFTASEIEYCELQGSRSASYAARFAAKEAVMKAIGKGWFDGIRWTDIEVQRGQNGKPEISLAGLAFEEFRNLGGARIHLSLTHSGNIAAAHVIFES